MKMNKSLLKYMGRLPTELVRIILSYSYCPQPQEHLDEIKDVWTSKHLLYNLYNRRFLHDYYDILYPKEEPRETLCFAFDMRTYFARHFYYFFRNPMLRTKKQVKRYMDCLRKKSPNVQINIYLGIMTADERAEFIDVYFSKEEVDDFLQLSTS
jgi:hypothetical protein